jgi:hypothetical protein
VLPNIFVCDDTSVSYPQPAVVGVKNHKNVKYVSIVHVEADTTSFIVVVLVIIFIAVAILVHKSISTDGS